MGRIEENYEATANLPGFEWDDWTRENLHVFRPRHLLLAKAIDRHLAGPRITIADVGCHNGFFLRLASHQGFERFLAVDFFELPPARSFLRGLEGAEFQRRNFNEPDFLNGIAADSVDCVISTEVFEHLFNHPMGYLQECWRVLRRGGLLVLSTPNPATLANAMRLVLDRPVQWGAVAFAETVKITRQGLPEAMWDIHFREYFQSELRSVINQLNDVEVVQCGFVATGAAPASALAKRALKSLQHGLGLGGRRLLSTTQYWVLRKRESSSRFTA